MGRLPVAINIQPSVEIRKLLVRNGAERFVDDTCHTLDVGLMLRGWLETL